MNPASKPKVSVKMMTYNHERFIGQALESVLMQQVSFDYEIVIGEDFSTDNTRDIVRGYQKKNPDRIRALLNPENMGRRYNARNTYKHCRGDYIAMLDGDDYWTSPQKLQKQIDFFDSHPGTTICFHNANRIYEDGRTGRAYLKKGMKTVMTMEDILPRNMMPSCSVVYRNHLFEFLPEAFDPVPFGDWPIQIYCAGQGKIGYIDEIMGVHRYHGGGVWTGGGGSDPDLKIRQMKWDLLFYKAVNSYLGHAYDGIIKKQVARRKKALRKAQLERLIAQAFSRFPQAHLFYLKIKRGLKGGALTGRRTH